jgi:hypothetical protein
VSTQEHLRAIGEAADDLGFLVESIDVDSIRLVSSVKPDVTVIVETRRWIDATTIRQVLARQVRETP